MNECRKRFWDTFEQMQEDFDRFFEHYANVKRSAMVYGTRWAPSCNIYDAGDSIRVLVEIAGMDREALDLRIEEEQVILRGTRSEPEQPAMGRYQQMEICFGEFELTVPLTSPVDAESAQAWYHNGFLSVLLPKIPVPKPLRITLSVPER